jgi:hypothetical protein
MYDVCLFVVVLLIHIVSFKPILEKIEKIPYRNFALQAKSRIVYSFWFRFKMVLFLFGTFAILSLVFGGIAYGPLYYLYIHGHKLVDEIEFLSSSWNMIYVMVLSVGYTSCCLITRLFILSKFDVYSKNERTKQKENNVISVKT